MMSRVTAWWMALGTLLLVAAVIVLLIGLGNTDREIAKLPTRAEVLKLKTEQRRELRQGCRAANARFNVLAAVLAGQRPSAQPGHPGSDYYATRPEELRAAQARFKRTLAALAPVNCQKRYPVPTIKDVTPGGDASDVRYSPAADP